MRVVLAAVLVCSLAACSASPEAVRSAPTLTPQASGASGLLIAAYAVNAETVWAAGVAGTVVKTTDGGATWTAMTVPGADSLQFRDVHAWSAQEALVLSIGNGTDSRVYRTDDGGATWTQTFTNEVQDAFYDCLDFWPDGGGLLFSDSVEGAFYIQRTTDYGRTWTRVPPEVLPPAQEAEGSFASSGTCLATTGDATAFIATGNAETPRLLRTDDRGASWTATDLPLAGGEAAGGASVTFGPGSSVIVAGGDIGKPEERSAAIATWTGSRWREGGALPFLGAAYGAAFVPESGVALAVGPGGVALSDNAGAGWRLLSEETHWGLAAAAGRAWLVGPQGRITRVDL
ncbi:MAG: oxidoreductase [Bacteroidota bacterium]